MKKLALTLVLIAGLLQAFPVAANFSRSDYFDWGPYYPTLNVLGVTFSSLEELPAPSLPSGVIPPPATGILPGNLLYPLERLGEGVQITFTFNAVAREQLRLNLAQERLQEALTLTQQNRPDLAAAAAVAYRDTLETVAGNLASLAQNLTPEVNGLLDQVNQTAAQGAVVAQASALTSPPATSAIWSDLAAGAETVMDAVAEATDQPAISDPLSADLQELKTQGLITPEQADKLYGLDTRSQVRGELDRLVTAGQAPLSVLAYLDYAVADRYPEAFDQTRAALEFAELRTYQSLPQPPPEALADLTAWENRSDPTLPPPETIRPYLYYGRGQDLAESIDLANFTTAHQTELAKFYPAAVTANPSYTPPPPPPSPSPSPSPLPSDAVPASEVAPSPSPIPPASAAVSYLGQYTGPLPGSFGYFFKQFGENVRALTTFDPATRVELNIELANERLREAAAVASASPDSPAYHSTLVRYRAIVDSFKDDVLPISTDSVQDNLAQKIEQELARHNTVFEKGLLPPPTDDVSAYTAAVRATEDAMDTAADALDRPALPPAFSSRLQDLKAQGLITPEEVDKLTAADSRSQVRELLRPLVDAGSFPPAEAKRLDEAQALVSPSDYNQLIEVRKIEELQQLRAIQSEFAQTATLRATSASFDQRLESLRGSIDAALIKPESLAGREDLQALYQELSATSSSRPINAGQFSPPSAGPAPADAVITTCPAGSIFKQFTGCVWESSGLLITDAEQYRCPLPGQYWSFVANGCVSRDPTRGDYPPDGQPACPAGYTWSWSLGGCYVDTGGQLPFPTPQPSPPPPGEEPACPQGASYQPPRGCVWDDTGRSVLDSNQYRCTKEGEYYSFGQKKCVPILGPDQPLPETDAFPTCPDPATFWSWADGRCLPKPQLYTPPETTVPFTLPDTSFIRPDSPFYFLDQAWERVQGLTAITPEARQRFRLAQAQERFGEAYDLLQRGQEDKFTEVLGVYTDTMQQVFNDVASGLNLSPERAAALGDELAETAVRDNAVLQQAAALASGDVTTSISAASSITIQALDRAADLAGEPPLPDTLKEQIQNLPEGMLTAQQEESLLNAASRVEARLNLAPLTASGILAPGETAFLDRELANIDPTALIQTNQLQVLDTIADLTKQKEELETRVTQTEEIAQKLSEFQRTYAPGQDIPADLRPYIRLTRIDEVAQTIRPDIVRLEDFGNRKDIQLAVATLQQEFRPTREAIDRVERFRRSNPNSPLPPDLARIEALSYGLGVRDAAGPCWLPSPPFAPNTPCPPPGAPIPVTNYYGSSTATPYPGIASFGNYSPPGERLDYGKGPQPTSPGVCPDGHHWMYDSGGWCMSNSGNYAPSTPNYSPTDPGYGYTPYTPYSGTYATGGGYGPPYYYGPAPSYYTTTPPPGTVPGTGPAPTTPGQCPPGFHWMPPSADQPGWCMANGGTYVPGNTPGSGAGDVSPNDGCPWGSDRQPSTNACIPNSYGPSYVTPPQSCSSGQSWSSAAGGCIPTGSTPGYYSPNLTQSSCGPGYYWDGTGCISIYSGGNSGPSPANLCQGFSCPSGFWLDYSSCSCRPSGTSGGSTSSPPYTSGSCTYPSGGCGPNSWYDYGSCSCRSSSSYSTGGEGSGCQSPSGGCSGGGWWNSSTCSCQYPSTSTSSSPPPSSSSSGSCPSGYHWMSDNGGWCMADGGYTSPSSSPAPTTSTSSSPAPTYSPPPSSEPAPAPSSEPAPSSAPPPSEPAPSTAP